ncbi:Uncharacterized protein TCM_022027 [Theobroma cacao]|uniref:Uncharacterized protein n=1 Tax=Theobroma cacao TaxID=3641 RepID=A0A061ETC6_THECC|nr:Uncharacterized protein TCM_022027 [Theobroma cacao]
MCANHLTRSKHGEKNFYLFSSLDSSIFRSFHCSCLTSLTTRISSTHPEKKKERISSNVVVVGRGLSKARGLLACLLLC